MDAELESPPVEVRKVILDYQDVPKHWIADHAAATHLVNAVNLLFPAGERFFVRSVRYYEDRVADNQKLSEQVRGFYGQESNHAREHERFFEVMEAQGYEIRRFLHTYKKFCYGFLEKIGPRVVRLSVTVASEHYTAVLAEDALQGELLRHAHPRMKELFSWHACEEIEHKAVAFDVLRKVNPSYFVRMVGFFFATLLLLGWWFVAFRMLTKQDGISIRQAGKSLRAAQVANQRKSLREVLVPGMRDYLRRDFYPWQNNNLQLARDYMASVNLAAE